jgi:hypothetical protein
MRKRHPGRAGRLSRAWLLPIAAAALLLQGCADYFVLEGHLKDDPMDQAIASGIASDHLKDTRAGLLKRFPPGQPVSEARRYLESVGATCRSPKPNESAVCDYRQQEDVVLRTPIGDFPSITSLYDFRISLASSQGRLSEIEVCERITRIDFFEPGDSPARKRTFPTECTTDPKPK